MSGIFFPQRTTLGFDGRKLTPCLVRKITFAGVKDRSEVEAARTMKLIGGVVVSPKTVGRVLHDVGGEYIELRDCPPSRLSRRLVPPAPANAPESVSVSCDGGRMMTRQPGQGPGVHDQAWRETKNADFARLASRTFETDPHPELPECFRDPEHVAKIAESAVLEVTAEDLDERESCEDPERGSAATEEPDQAPREEEPSEMTAAGEVTRPDHTDSRTSDAEGSPESCDPMHDPDDWRPKRLHRTCLSSLKAAKAFGLQMKREAQRRRFFEATSKAFLADGLGWNWSIWRRHFRDFEPVLDFIHAVEYLYEAAKADEATEAESWETYLRWAEWCWQGKAAEVIAEMAERLRSQGVDPSSNVDSRAPHAVLHTAHRYLSNNASRMDYARYRRQGMPVTSAPMESLVKQINLRVKGTEMFWNDNESGEGILQLRSAYLCDDDRLEHYLNHRPGHPYVRRTTQITRLQPL